MFFSLALSNHEDLWGEVQMNVNWGKSVIFAKGIAKIQTLMDCRN